MSHPVAPPPAEQSGSAVPPQGGPAVPPDGAVPPPPPIPGYPAEKKKSGKARLLGILGIILVAVVVIGLKSGLRSLFADDPMGDAKVGACVTNTADVQDNEVVPCTDAKAAYSIVGRIENTSKSAFDADKDGAMCDPYPTTESLMWIDGDVVICLAPTTK